MHVTCVTIHDTGLSVCTQVVQLQLCFEKLSLLRICSTRTVNCKLLYLYSKYVFIRWYMVFKNLYTEPILTLVQYT
jgi:hypothetical protein